MAVSIVREARSVTAQTGSKSFELLFAHYDSSAILLAHPQKPFQGIDRLGLAGLSC
jgi:hypothetical protein